MRPKIDLIENQNGGFYKAFINNHPVSKAELFDVLECEDDGFRLSYYAENFVKSHPEWELNVGEIDLR